MKNGRLRRGLFALLLVGSLLCVYLYWVQVVGRELTALAPRRQQRIERRNGFKLWTWQCVSNRCVKKEKEENKSPTSLETCNMLCGSTQLWPQPTGPVQLGNGFVTFYLHQLRFETTAQGEDRDFLNEAFAIFKQHLKTLIDEEDDGEKWPGVFEIDEFRIKVVVANLNVKRPKLGTDESYTLTLKPVEKNLVATVRAKTYFGARHGLETLSQLIWKDDGLASSSFMVLKKAAVQDTPKFPYRGLMLDTARQFFSLDAIKRVLIGMGSCKMNVFHWHMTDSQSFPFDSPRVPQMAKYGALSADKVYSAEDVKQIVEFARIRGIRVLIEIDVPAHSGNGWNWGPSSGMGELAVCVNEQPWSNYCGEPPCGQLNPENPKVYEVLWKLYKDVLELSGEKEMVHIGGDEVNFRCWDEFLPSKKRLQPLQMFNYTEVDYFDVWGNFTVEAIKTLERANNGEKLSNVIMWSSDLTKKPYIDKYVSKDKVIVQVWGGSTWTETTDLLMMGYRIIISHVDAWYLDCGFGKWRETGTDTCPPYKSWQMIYNHRPWHTMYSLKNHSNIVGGEACMWTEQTDEVSLDPKLWPRTAALAERLWSDPAVVDDDLVAMEDVYTRLNTHRNRLIKRGLKAEAMWPSWCVQNPGQCL